MAVREPGLCLESTWSRHLQVCTSPGLGIVTSEQAYVRHAQACVSHAQACVSHAQACVSHVQVCTERTIAGAMI